MWSDTPIELDRSIHIAHAATNGNHAGCHAVEVRRSESNADRYYLTAGNLFRSQTVQVDGAENALILLCRITTVDHGGNVDPLEGCNCRILPNRDAGIND